MKQPKAVYEKNVCPSGTAPNSKAIADLRRMLVSGGLAASTQRMYGVRLDEWVKAGRPIQKNDLETWISGLCPSRARETMSAIGWLERHSSICKAQTPSKDVLDQVRETIPSDLQRDHAPFVDAEVWEAMRSAARSPQERFLCFGNRLGLRPGEYGHIDKTESGLARRNAEPVLKIVLESAKNQQKVRYVPVSGDADPLVECFNELSAVRSGKRLVCRPETASGPAGRPVMAHEVTSCWRELVQRAGREDVRISGHSGRRSCVAQLAAAGFSAREILPVTGHSRPSSLKPYFVGYETGADVWIPSEGKLVQRGAALPTKLASENIMRLYEAWCAQVGLAVETPLTVTQAGLWGGWWAEHTLVGAEVIEFVRRSVDGSTLRRWATSCRKAWSLTRRQMTPISDAAQTAAKAVAGQNRHKAGEDDLRVFELEPLSGEVMAAIRDTRPPLTYWRDRMLLELVFIGVAAPDAAYFRLGDVVEVDGVECWVPPRMNRFHTVGGLAPAVCVTPELRLAAEHYEDLGGTTEDILNLRKPISVVLAAAVVRLVGRKVSIRPKRRKVQ